MVCLGLKPGAAGWKAQTNPLSYSGTPKPWSLAEILLRQVAGATYTRRCLAFWELQMENKLLTFCNN